MGESVLKMAPKKLRSLVDRLAAHRLAAVIREDSPSDGVTSVVVSPAAVRTVAAATMEILQQLPEERGRKVRELLTAPGETEVPFALQLGQWQVIGRFPRLLTTPRGREIVVWTTDGDGTALEIGKRHEPLLRLQALALQRSSPPGPTERKMQVHLVLLQPSEVASLQFRLAELDSFSAELTHDLEMMGR